MILTDGFRLGQKYGEMMEREEARKLAIFFLIIGLIGFIIAWRINKNK